MIEIALYFSQGDLENVLSGLQKLPEAIHPIYFSDSESMTSANNTISDTKRFGQFKGKNSEGFFLLGNSCLYDIKVYSEGYSKIYVDLPEELQDYVLPFFEVIAQSNIEFGYAADGNEIKHRNRYYKTIGVNNIEDWVGRDISKYVPGLYCYTLLSQQLIEKHSVDLPLLVSSASSYYEFGNDGRLHLLRFYEDTKAWRSESEKLDELCYRNQGVFSIKLVAEVVDGIDNLLEYDDVIFDWR